MINNLVPEDRRDKIFSTQIPGDLEGEVIESQELRLEDRVEKLEIIVKKLIEYLVKESEPKNGV